MALVDGSLGGDRAVHAAAHRHEYAVRVGMELWAALPERLVERVRSEVSRVHPLRREAAELGRDVLRGDAGGVEEALPADELHDGTARSACRRAAFGIETGRRHPIAAHVDVDADQISAGRAAGRCGVRQGTAASPGRGQVVIEGGQLHPREGSGGPSLPLPPGS